MVQLECSKLHWLPLVMAVLFSLSVGLPYFISVGLGHVDPFIPYISHAAAFPPGSAYFSIFATLAAPWALVTFSVRYVIVDHKRSRPGRRRIRILNIVSFVFGLLAIFCMTYRSHQPLAQHDEDWVLHVAVPHLISMVLLFLFVTSYVLTQAYLTFALRTAQSSNIFIRGLIGMVVVITCWTTFIPFNAALRDTAQKVTNKGTGAVNLEGVEYSFFYIISSLSEWGFIFFSLLFMATFYTDFQCASMKIELKPKVADSIYGRSSSRQVLNGQEVTKM